MTYKYKGFKVNNNKGIWSSGVYLLICEVRFVLFYFCWIKKVQVDYFLPNEGRNSHLIKTKQIDKNLTLWSFSKLKLSICMMLIMTIWTIIRALLWNRAGGKYGRKPFSPHSVLHRSGSSCSESCWGLLKWWSCVNWNWYLYSTPAGVVLHLHSLVYKPLWYPTTSWQKIVVSVKSHCFISKTVVLLRRQQRNWREYPMPSCDVIEVALATKYISTILLKCFTV